MNRAQKYFLHLPKGTHFEKIIDTEYGKENIYVSPDGKKHSIPINPQITSWATKKIVKGERKNLDKTLIIS